MKTDNPHSPGLSESQCDDISERSAIAVMRQVSGILQGAAERELRARASAGQTHLDPFYALSGPVSGALTASISALWGMMMPDEDPAKAAASLRGLLLAIVDSQMEHILTEPPGKRMAAIIAAEAKRKGRMT